MADEKDKAAVEAKLNEELTKATTPDEIRDVLLAQPRDEKGQFAAKPVAAAPVVVPPPVDPPEVTVFKDTFLIGGKEVEFTGDNPADILKQFKAAQQAYEMAKQPEPKKEEVKPAGPTKEELAALQLKAATGDAEAMSEYMVKSGALDRYLEAKGIKPAEIQQVLQERASEKVAKDWDGAVKDFLADSDWPGGSQNEELLKYKLAELKDEKGQPLAYAPSKASLQKAYEALKEEKMLFAAEEKTTEEKKTIAGVSVGSGTDKGTHSSSAGGPTATKRAPTGSTAFGTSQESGTRRASPTTPQVPTITDDMTPQQIMEAWKQQVVAEGKSPDDALRTTYAGRA